MFPHWFNLSRNPIPLHPIPSCSSTASTAALTPYTRILRFSDFDWLQLRLREEYPGVVVPPLPEKQGLVDVAAQEVLQASGVQEDDDLWLEQRTAALDRMLKRIYAHPLLSGSPSLQACLMTRTRTRALTPQP